MEDYWVGRLSDSFCCCVLGIFFWTEESGRGGTIGFCLGKSMQLL